ncbi:MAG: hypothetical protein K0R09_3118, partial [Clostridiales bacterium]|nr:hypothetical protein [Clostridiales bacterium]
MDNGIEKYLSEIIPKIEQKKCILFLGAGASISAGGMSWNQLLNDLKRKFNKINFENDDFFQICEDICDTFPYNRNDLLD